MSVSPKAALEPSSAVALDQPSTEVVFNPENCFDQWLEYVQANHKQFTVQAPETAKEKVSEIYMESLPGSNCEVTFEGVLHFDGHSMGNIRSSGGALVVTKRGRIDADIDVGVAVINGSVTGNITATERVFLDSAARVTGQINTRLLSVKPGAVFEGDCLFTATEGRVAEELLKEEKSKELDQLLVGV